MLCGQYGRRSSVMCETPISNVCRLIFICLVVASVGSIFIFLFFFVSLSSSLSLLLSRSPSLSIRKICEVVKFQYIIQSSIKYISNAIYSNPNTRCKYTFDLQHFILPPIKLSFLDLLNGKHIGHNV